MTKNDMLANLLEQYFVNGKLPYTWGKTEIEERSNKWKRFILEETTKWPEHDFKWIIDRVKKCERLPGMPDFYKYKAELEKQDRKKFISNQEYKNDEPKCTYKFAIFNRKRYLYLNELVGSNLQQRLIIAKKIGELYAYATNSKLNDYIKEDWYKIKEKKIPLDQCQINPERQIKALSEDIRDVVWQTYLKEVGIENLPEQLPEVEAEEIPF